MSRSKLVTVLLVFAAAKLWLRTATAADLRFLLAPVDLFVGGATGSPGVWTAEGYHHPDLGMVIDASCAGANFFCIAFLLLAYYLLRDRDGWAMIPLAALLALPVTIVVNVSRILTLLRVGEAPALVSDGVWHQAWGVFTYAGALILLGLFFFYRSPARRAAIPHPTDA